jgi:leucyl/phenylalanyl-tRNA--protein transferase
MFTRVANASKVAFVRLVQGLTRQGFQLIDCQVFTTHLQSLGAELIPREEFLSLLKPMVEKTMSFPEELPCA